MKGTPNTGVGAHLKSEKRLVNSMQVFELVHVDLRALIFECEVTCGLYHMYVHISFLILMKIHLLYQIKSIALFLSFPL